VLALVFQLFAIELLQVSHFEALKRGISMTGSVVNGRIFFGEAVSVRKLSSVAVMLGGIVMLSLR
jgi:multidrug transporter EmrE-like cation transporter